MLYPFPMEHDLIDTVVVSLVLAFILGLIFNKLKFPTIFGYLIAGVIIGPFTPGFVADAALANQLAEIGIILLMFGVGLHFSFPDLLKVKKIAVPGALFQMGVAAALGAGVALLAGFSLSHSLVFGFSLSVASTVVLLRALEMRGQVTSESGKIAVGWLIVEDIAMVLALVLLPVIAGMLHSGQEITFSAVMSEVIKVAFKIGGFIVFMVVIGTRLLPRIFNAIAKTKSSELSTLGTLAIALGFAFLAYTVFDASFALGAFLAGLVLNESEVGHKAAEDSLPMRDAFAVLFFVSVGMLFDPMTLLEHPFLVLVTLLVIIVGKAAAALMITSIFRQKRDVSLTIAISLAQIGEFSFILAGMAMTHDLINDTLYNLILAGALLSIALNPFLFKLLDRKLASDKKAEPFPTSP